MSRHTWSHFVACSFAVAGFLANSGVAGEADIPARPEYNRDVRPILADACFRCHGFDKNKREADRRLDTREGALAEQDGIRAIVPGKLTDSDVHTRIHSKDRDEIMPPPKASRQLSAREKEIIDRWIEQGGEYQEHWAYIAPTRPAIPNVKASAANSDVSNPIDAFIFARQQELGLQRVGEADRATLIRRLSLDLRGLPPRPGEFLAFEKEDTPDGYEKLVERLLASPHYGERMAVWWLDLVRYADSIGYHSDNPRNVWPYRDYVIRSFNEGMRFDRFTIEQLAGDLLPNATQAQKVASGYNRLILTTEEGGAQAKQYEAKHVTDRVKSVGTTWLAQTLMCAECHDHKFDPVSTRDFYALGAFFADIKEASIGSREPGMLVPTPEQEAEMKIKEAKVAVLRAQLDATSPEIEAAQLEWENAIIGGPPVVTWSLLRPVKASAEQASHLIVRENKTIKVEVAGNAASDSYQIELTLPVGTTGVQLEVLPSQTLPASGPGRASNGNFVLNEFKIERGGQPLKISSATATFEQGGYPAKATIDGIDSGRNNGWAVMGNTGRESAAYFELETPLAQETPVIVRMHQRYGDNHTIGKFRLSATTAPKPIRAPNLGIPVDVAAAVQKPRDQRDAAMQAKIGKHFRSTTPLLEPLRNEVVAAEKERDVLMDSVGRCLVSESMPTPRNVRVLPRGDWMNESGDVVKPSTPHFLPVATASADEKRLTRLDLANWLVARENPLTARVFVNRLWKLFYGTGLSKSVDDLGTQGEVPMNQALLDWLACEFVDSGWDVKHMIRLMVTSRTYRLASSAPREFMERDPFNRELARGGRWRLDAEFVRDNALAISNLLVHQVGGPSVKPYQPAGYWENLNFPTREWDNDKDRGQWRRGLYTWWQRSYLHPSLLAFDASTREECTADRARSNIPQQSLVLLNDTTYVEAARAFASRILREGGADAADKCAWAFREATGRVPRDDEREILGLLYERHLALYTQDGEAAKKLIGTGYSPVAKEFAPSELAAWTSVARTILNLHETITRL